MERLSKAKRIIGHNIVNFDIPVIKKFFPKFKEPEDIYDTLLVSQLFWANTEGPGSLYDLDMKALKKGQREGMPGYLYGAHSLKAWGYRLGVKKGEFNNKQTDWSKWTQEMSDYCEQDLPVTKELYLKLLLKNVVNGCSPEARQLEHQVAAITTRQTHYGVVFDYEGAVKLHQQLTKDQEALDAKIIEAFGPTVEKPGTIFIPKRDNKSLGYKKGVAVKKPHTEPTNPGSGDHLAYWFEKKYGWKPEKLSAKTGKASMDDAVLKGLDYPEAELLRQRSLVTKRLGMVSNGANGWLKLIRPDTGRVHGEVKVTGTVTHRMAHKKPNLAQIPKVKKSSEGEILYGLKGKYGAECRTLFTVPEDKVLIGVDASGVQLRCLAHYMGRYDGGEYAEQLLKGDIHSVNQQALGLSNRDTAKTWVYAWLFGAGDAKLGRIVGKGVKEGHRLKASFLSQIPALGKLAKAVASTVRSRGSIRGLDGRVIYIRSQHSALNFLLQSAEGVLMKKALVILDTNLQETQGLKPGVDYEFVLNVHDEWQIEAKPEHADLISRKAIQSIKASGRHFKFRCPLDGEARKGKNWCETH